MRPTQTVSPRLLIGDHRCGFDESPPLTMPERSSPSVDIVVNNFNYARFLGEAIESALAQTYESVRVIVVDDGSTDHSREVIAAYGDRIEPVLKDNEGQASALNAGLARVRGDIVIFLDSDDLLTPQAAERIAAVFRKCSELVKVHYRMTVIDGEGNPTGSLRPHAHHRLPVGDLRIATTRFPFDLPRSPTTGNAFATQVLRTLAPIKDCGVRTGADWYVVHLAALLGPVGAIEEPLALYRIHGANRYETDSASVDLEHIRATIEHTSRAQEYIQETAVRLGLDCDPDDVSMSVIADRAISRKLDPSRHPIAGDTLPKLVALGARAAMRRFDVVLPLKVAFVVWLLCLTVAPRPIARRLAELFVYPEQRRGINRWLAKMHRRR